MVYVPQIYVPGQEESTPTASTTTASAPTAYVPGQAASSSATSSSSVPVVQAVAYPAASAPPPPTAPHYSAPVQSNSLPTAVQGTYVPSPAASVPSNQNHYAQYPTAAASSAPAQQSSTTSEPLPDFSLALDLPPPVISSTTSTAATTSSTSQPYTKNDYSSYPSEPLQAAAPTSSAISEGNPIKCHKVDYEIKGNDMQLVEVELDPDETVIAEAGAMMFMEEGIDFKAKLGDGSNPSQGFFGSIFAAAGRIITGESLFLTHFTNRSHYGKARVAFAAPYPGTVLPINMGAIGEKLICQKDAFLCAAYGTKVSVYFNKRLGSGLFGGEGFILQKLEGDGMAFIHAGGTIVKRELNGEKLRVDTGCLVAFTRGIDFSVQLAPGLKTILFGGEGLFLATLQGHGTVWLQSLPFSRLADRILANAPSAGGRRTGEGSYITGGFGDLIDGDGFGRFR